MRPLRLILYLITAAAAISATPSRAQEKVTLTYKAKPGQVVRYSMEGSLSLEAGPAKLKLEMKETEKVTFTAVGADGAITRESQTESSETTVNGQKMPEQDDSKSKTTTVCRANGTLVSHKSEKEEKDETHIGVRLNVATTPIFPDHPVGVGDKWATDTKPDAELGTRAGHADCEVLAFEKAKGVDCVKIKMTYKEGEGSPPLGVTGTYWLEKSSGDSVVSEIEIENLQFGGKDGPMASGSMRQERTEGNPLGATAAAAAKPGETKTETKTETKPEPKKEKTIDEVVKDHERIPGIFTLYRKKEAGRDTIYLEIREDQLDKLMLFQATASTGTSNQSQVVAGDPINDLLIKFVKRDDDKILMVTPNIGFRVDKNAPMDRSLRRSFADAYLDAYKIEAKQPDRKSLLINVSDLFRGDIAQVSQCFSGGGSLQALLGGGGGASYSMDREKTSIRAIKCFPENLAVETEYHFQRSGASRGASLSADALADPRSIPLKVVYNLFFLPETGYRPRLADPRVGYFTTDYEDFSRLAQDDDNIVHYIHRWNLEKADPKAKLSPPKKPIVFWIDNAVPVEYRDAAREGLLRWNTAFEKAGIKDAIVVKQMPDDADWDHADMRYNVFRWVTSSDSAYMIAQARTNPITGEVLNASISADCNVVRYLATERKKIVNPASAFEEPLLLPTRSTRDDNFAEMRMEQAWFGDIARHMVGTVSPLDEKRYINDMLRDTICHEMGHILGLRHNFVASTQASMQQLASADFVNKHAITASVMDYAPFNLAALKQKNTPYWNPCLGKYDFWAIEYGYKTVPDARTPEAELFALKSIASRCTEPGLAYQTDESADGFDPYVVRHDLSSDPMAYYLRYMQTGRYLMLNLSQRVPKKGESYYQFTRQLMMLLNVQARAAASVARFVGGLSANRNHRGDPGEKPTLVPIPGAKQREAVRIISTYVLSETAFSMPRSYYTKLASDPQPDMATMIQAVLGGGQDFSIRDTLSNIQTGALKRLFRADVMKRVLNNEFKVGDPKQAFTLAEMFDTVGTTVWSELGARRSVSALRRQLQRAHADLLIQMVLGQTSVPDDARMLAWDQLRQLKHRIAGARGSRQLDTYTRIHLDESAMRIDRALSARQTVGGTAAPSTQSLLQQLLGGH